MPSIDIVNLLIIMSCSYWESASSNLELGDLLTSSSLPQYPNTQSDKDSILYIGGILPTVHPILRSAYHTMDPSQ